MADQMFSEFGITAPQGAFPGRKFIGPQRNLAGPLPTVAPPTPDMIRRMAPPGAPFAPPPMPDPSEAQLPSRPPMFPSGFDPMADTPGRASYGGPRLDNAGALAGLQAMAPKPGNGLGGYGSMEELYKQASGGAGNAGWSQGMAKRQLGLMNDEQDYGIERGRDLMEPIQSALASNHPAIQGMQALKAQQASLPQQATAAGTILAAKKRAEGDVQAADITASGKQQGDTLTFITQLMQRLNEAREQSRQYSGSKFSDFAEPNRLNEQDYQGLINALVQRQQF